MRECLASTEWMPRFECGSDGLRFFKYRSDGLQVSSTAPIGLRWTHECLEVGNSTRMSCGLKHDKVSCRSEVTKITIPEVDQK
jgi:hypothetical protein